MEKILRIGKRRNKKHPCSEHTYRTGFNFWVGHEIKSSSDAFYGPTQPREN